MPVFLGRVCVAHLKGHELKVVERRVRSRRAITVLRANYSVSSSKRYDEFCDRCELSDFTIMLFGYDDNAPYYQSPATFARRSEGHFSNFCRREKSGKGGREREREREREAEGAG